ncbi:MAG: adenosine deaminase [Firmicutes bacterium]|nr:adenosine deaminase [Bacillota bacterium]
MTYFRRFYLDKEKDIIVNLYKEDDALRYVLRTPNHNSGNLITNLAKLCDLPLSFDEDGLKVIRGTIPCYIDGYNQKMYIFRMGNTKIANIFPDGSIEMKASIPSISKTLMSQTKDYRLDIKETIIKTYILEDCKFRSDLHTHMNANLEPDVLIALGILHQIRYPLYYIKKLGLRCSDRQQAMLDAQRAEVALRYADSPLTGKYLERRIDDNTIINFADLILNNIRDAAYNLSRIRTSLAILKDGQAVFTNLEKVYLYRYVFTKGVPADNPIVLEEPERIPDADIINYLLQMIRDHASETYRSNTLFQDKLLWIARGYRRHGIDYVEISDTTLVKPDASIEMLAQVHRVMPAIYRETGVVIRFLAGIRRIPLTLIKDHIPSADYLLENLRVLHATMQDPYVAGCDIIGEEINNILDLQPAIRELVRMAAKDPTFVIRIHAGENDSLRDNVANSIRCVAESLAPGQSMPHLRIGHGLYTSNLRSPKGRQLIQLLLDNHVVLEFQISSNVRLNNLSSMEHHPLKAYLHAGISCVQGTDGSAIYGTDSIDEQLTLEKLLDLTHEDLLRMRATEKEVIACSLRDFEHKKRIFDELRGGRTPEDYLAECIRQAETLQLSFPFQEGLLDAETALSGRIKELPGEGTPIILVGGSFNNDTHRTRMTPAGLRLIDQLLQADPDKYFFIIGHRLRGYEKYLVEQNQGRFRIFAFVPSRITPAEKRRLLESGVSIRIAIESSGMGVYKSISYEVFKNRPSILIALDGNSAGANTIQEAKNGRYRSRIYVNAHAAMLRAKAATLQGYAVLFRPEDTHASVILGE